MKINSGIYQIENRTNGKSYVGSSENLRKRWQAHLSALRSGQHHNCHLQRAFDKYGEATFVFSVLEDIGEASRLIPREQHHLDMLNPEYNLCPTAGSCLGYRHTEDTKQKIREATLGEHNPNYGKYPDEETRGRISEAKRGERNPNYGKRFRKERRRKIGETRRGKTYEEFYGLEHAAEFQQKLTEAHKGKHHSEETRAKMSIMRSGKRHPMYGKHHTMETRRKISEALKGRRLSAEIQNSLADS